MIDPAVELRGIRLRWGNDGVLALLTSLALFLGISLAQSPPRLAPDIEAALDV